MKRTLLALSAVALLTTVEGCGCCRNLWRRNPQPVVVPSAPAAPSAPCCAPGPCDGCDSCTGAPVYGTPAYDAPMGGYMDSSGGYTTTPTLPADGYGNPAPVPGG